ncbi:MAG: hypothetical protein JRJ05_07600 [Deltaproteobacteria bacterium]|nr:hypothetical protein [Deltaproteobacteria bacterium]
MAHFRRVLPFAFAVGFLLGSAPAPADLVIHLKPSASEYTDPAEFEFSVILKNHGDAPLVVLPQSLRREYVSLGNGTAHYSPYPGPPIKPWNGAFLLRPGLSRTLMLRGMNDGDGVWRLDPGRYELNVRLSVTREQARASAAELKELGAAIWEGEIQSSKILVTYSPAPSD